MKQQYRSVVVEPGAYMDVDFDTYASWDAANASTLGGFAFSARHVYDDMLQGGSKVTPAKEFGWLFHLAVLEPKRFEAEVNVPPVVNKRTKKGKEIFAQWEAENPDVIPVDEETYDKLTTMRERVMAHETAAEFLSGPGRNEVSLVWDDEKHAVRCKARMDRVAMINEWPFVGDLKAMRCARREEFERSITNYGYDLQAAHYLNGAETLFPIEDGSPFRKFLFIVVENTRPFGVACYEADDVMLEYANEKRDEYLRRWRECVTSGYWPDYYGGKGIEYVCLPQWELKKFHSR